MGRLAHTGRNRGDLIIRLATAASDRESESDSADDLIERVLAEGQVEFDTESDKTDYDKLVAQSLKSSSRPFGKRLEIVRIGDGWSGTRRAIRLAEHFSDRVEARPVLVPQRVGAYHPVVKTFLNNKDWQYVSPEHLRRAARILQATAAEAGHRGYQLRGHEDRRRPLPATRRHAAFKGHLAIVIDDRTYGIDLREKSKRGAAKLTPRNYTKPARLPQWQENRNYEFLPSGVLELTIHGCGSNRRTTFRDTKSTSVEELLPEVFREVEIQVLEDQWRRDEAERKKARRQIRWQAAMEQAERDFGEAYRAKQLRAQLSAWQEARQLAEYLAAMDTTIIQMSDPADAAAATAWLQWAREHAEQHDPLRHRLRMPTPPKPTADDLKPFLHGWSPYGPSC